MPGGGDPSGGAGRAVSGASDDDRDRDAAHGGDGLRVAVLSCGDLGWKAADRLADLPEVGRVLLLTAPFRQKERSPLERLIRSLRYDGLRDTLAGLLRRLRRGGEPGEGAPGPPDGPARPDVEHRRVPAFEAPTGLETLEGFRPDLGVLAGTYILPESVFDLPRLGSINLHTGKAPEYRGSAPAFWELYHAEDQVGVTVHEVTSELDAGRILLQESVPLSPAPSGDPVRYVETFRSETLEPAGVRLIAEAVGAVARGEVELRSQDETRARYFGPPTRGDIWRLRLRVADRRLRRRLADLAGRAAFGSGLAGRRLSDRAVIVLYHRVTDQAAGNPLACTPEAFERHCAFYRRHFRVVGLGELVDELNSGGDPGGRLAITFDDGYRDNYTVARPILERHGLPACFFLATGYLGTERVPRWDELRGETPAWMSWEDVSDLLDRGFEVGAHTRNHVDLGQVDGEEARREIVAAGRDIARQTGEETSLFSYPFGGRDNLTEANRRRVREAGYSCCLSAFGGSVSADTDPYRIPRVPVSDWWISPYHLGLQLLRE